MNKTLRAIEQGVKASLAPLPPQKFQAGGKAIICSHCGSDGFKRLNGPGRSWAGYGLQCLQCSHLVYFGEEPVEIEGAA
jgi:hypothetical protein